MLVSVKLVCVYVKLLKFKVQVKGRFCNYGKTRVVFAKYNWIGGNFKISEGWFCKHIFPTLSPVKIYIHPRVSLEMYVLNFVKIWVEL
jgi:hypothetical protein